ncbi:isochorismatase family protein [uncultured Sphingomonas sp.]|uniref:isochorismatase family protein n=1 Tax=uncultured Sphingomonas sp. TaxID=158754 RepID=UPI0025FC329A|nr:isochorismatase family protein [uncultured Sphingomonas sp.]
MTSALVIIDMQQVMQDRIEARRPHVNGDAPTKISGLATAFRDAGRPVIHVRHADPDPSSPLHPKASGYPPIPCAVERPGEAVFVKRSSSAFATTVLADHLRAQGLSHLYLVGAVAGFCVNSTARAACDLGFRVTVVPDAVLGFDLPAAGLEAQTIFDVTMGLLAADFGELRDSGAVLAQLG